MRLSKVQLDNLSTTLGLCAAISVILAQYGWIPDRIGGTISAISLACLGYLTNKPASAHPTTEEVEGEAVDRRHSA
jgi:hypothetical protein